MTKEKKTQHKTDRRKFLQTTALGTGGLVLASGVAGAEQATRKLKLKGYSIPLSPEGKSSLVTATPHHYGGQFIFIDYRADEDLSKGPAEVSFNHSLNAFERSSTT